MPYLYNETGFIGQMIYYATVNITGDLYLTLLSMTLILICFFMLFKIPMEFTAILILPFFIVMMSYTHEFVSIGAALLTYLAILLAKMFLFK